MLLPLLLAVAPLMAPPQADDPLITVRLNHDTYNVGDRARIYIETARDGYVVILHADPVGRVRVLFPIDPGEDNFVRGERKFEVLGRSGREGLQMEYEGGTGTILAAYSRDPFTFDELTRNGHWDFAALGGPDQSVKRDPLAGLLEIMNNMARGNPFDYDVTTYVVNAPETASDADGYGSHSHFGIGLAFGYPYPFGVGFAFGYPYYSPFYFMPFWGWYGFGAGYPYAPYYRPLPVYHPFYGTPTIYTGGFATGFTRKQPGVQSTFTPIQPRPRGGSTAPVAIGNRGSSGWGVQPRNRSTEPRVIQPRSRGIAPRGGSPHSSSVWGSFFGTRGGFSGVSRSLGGFGGSRGGFGGVSIGRGVGGRHR
ncbi:MAG TPA: DUF4384 domain-containing protein [Gemmatimonadales bacterium]|nr:DUF4384 domain-containing protein [Gemmatimonadales bacterium]